MILDNLQQIPPKTTFAVIQELIHHDGLRIALSGRDDVLLEPVLRLLVKHVTDPRFGELVCDVATIVIGTHLLIFSGSFTSVRHRYVQPSRGPISSYRCSVSEAEKESNGRNKISERAGASERCIDYDI